MLFFDQAFFVNESQIFLNSIVLIDFLLLQVKKFSLVDCDLLKLLSIVEYQLLLFFLALSNAFLLPVLILTMLLQNFLDFFNFLCLVKLLVFQLDLLFLFDELQTVFYVLGVLHILGKRLHDILHLFFTLSHHNLLVLGPEVPLVSLLLRLNFLQIDCCVEKFFVIVT